jgi:hypothetical protein
MSKDVKNPLVNHKTTALPDAQRQEPARQYLDLTTGKVCADDYKQTPNQEQENPGVVIVTEDDGHIDFSGGAKRFRPKSTEQTKAQREGRELRNADSVAQNAQRRVSKKT